MIFQPYYLLIMGNILTFNFTDRTGQSNTKIIYLNTTFTIPNSTIDDIDGDGLNNSDDKVFGNTSHIIQT